MHSLSDILFLIMSWTHLATNTLGVQKKPITLINSVFFCNVPDALVLHVKELFLPVWSYSLKNGKPGALHVNIPTIVSFF